MTNEELIKKIETQIDFEKKSESEYNIGRRDAYTNVLILFKQLEEPTIIASKNEPELPVIPQFVASAIEKTRETRKNITILNIFNEVTVSGFYTEKVDDWICKNDEIFARAWIDENYTIEKEANVKVSIKSNDKTEFEVELPESAAKKLINDFRTWDKLIKHY